MVSYSVGGTATDGGTDYTTLPVNVTIPANTTTATIDVTGINDDSLVEGTETVVVTLTGTDDALIGIDATPATVNILDNDSATVSIAATTDANEAGPIDGLFTLTMTTASESATVVSYSVGGTATDGGTDYTTLPVNVTIPANTTTAGSHRMFRASMTQTANSDRLLLFCETVVVTVASAPTMRRNRRSLDRSTIGDTVQLTIYNSDRRSAPRSRSRRRTDQFRMKGWQPI